MANLERIYTIPLGDAYDYIRTKRAKRAIKIIKEFAIRHMKANDAKLSQGVNAKVFQNGMQKPPRRIKVRIVKGEDLVAKVWLIGEEEKLKEEEAKKAAQKEKSKEKEEKKEPSLQKKEPDEKKGKEEAQAQASKG
jgi:large subunit ribosomal protein L31e